MESKSELLDIKQASQWASQHLKKNVTPSNISYLIQYGRIKKIGNNGNIFIDKRDLLDYYKTFLGRREIVWKSQLGNDLNWDLSFDKLKESDTTKHVHRLHPYKGKFIPQLVEYFLDNHTDNFKKHIYFKRGDVVLDPFCGSGTTLIQANELGMHALGVDISDFNSLISNVKISKYDFVDLKNELQNITKSLKQFNVQSNAVKFENELMHQLNKFNNRYFPSPEFKFKVKYRQIEEENYGDEKQKKILPVFVDLIKKYNIKLKQEKYEKFIDKWYLDNIRREIDFVFNLVKKIRDQNTRNMASVILSRTMRSCRATTHADLATLKEPVTSTYYCSKHGKICKPLFSILSWWVRYSNDTLNRLSQFNKIRTDTHQICLTGDSRKIDLFDELGKENPAFADSIKNKKIKGIFSSPPYVGLIDYHQQHAYAYDLLGFERKDELEIGSLFKGQSQEAKKSYIKGVSDVLNNCKRFLARDYVIFLVANDKCNLYPKIAEFSGMRIINQYKRPVLNRTEKDKGAYSEIIFHLKSK